MGGCKCTAVRDVMAHTLARQHQLAEVLAYVHKLFTVTNIAKCRSIVGCILEATFLQQKFYNIAEVSVFLLLYKIFCSPAFVPVFYFSVCLLVLLGLVDTFRVC